MSEAAPEAQGWASWAANLGGSIVSYAQEQINR
jgi:hypothetical protein